MGHVFISHVPEDAARAQRLQGMLEAAGLTVWRDSLLPGQYRDLEVRRAIEQARAFVPCFSEHTQGSATSRQYAELAQAVTQARLRAPGRQWIFPVRFADCQLPEYDLGPGHDLDSLGKTDLFGRAWEPAVALLVAALRPVTMPAAPAGPAAPAAGAASSGAEAELSSDVQDSWRPLLAGQSGVSGLPGRWAFGELDELRRAEIARNPGGSRAADALAALCQAVRAKPVLLAVDRHGELGIGHLQVIYYREVGSWPDGGTADALLVEAASVSVAERHAGAGQELGALARFVVGVAAVLGVSPRRDKQLARWVESLGFRLADAVAYYAPRSEQQFWLHVDLGPEPGPWPEEVTWMLLGRGRDVVGKPVACAPTADGLKRALGEVVRAVQPVAPNLVVDLAVPRALMDEGIEHWPLIEVDGQFEPLSARHQPRLRWSQLRRNRELERRHSDRVTRTAPNWGGQVTRWLCADPRQPFPCFITGTDVTVHQDRLRALLREGCGFVIWFPAGAGKPAAAQVSRAVRRMKGPARRLALPEHLPAFGGREPAVIWDDPGGRGLTSLPPLVAPESP